MRNGVNNKGSAKLTATLQMKRASGDNPPASATCRRAGEPGTEAFHQLHRRARPSTRACEKSAGNAEAVKGMNNMAKRNSATCTAAPKPKDLALAAVQPVNTTSGSRSANTPDTARPEACISIAVGKSAAVRSKIDCKIHTCHRASIGNGTLMDLSRPSECTFGFTMCMTIVSPASAGSKERKHIERCLYSMTAAAVAWTPRNRPAKCEVPTSCSKE
mmetsp:Transcript_23102/g.66987  ORF Transcript_23102/g.66987 Transcript_23102/m.66987 type:complete len:217 (-) Transcript_23102:305-955(-)